MKIISWNVNGIRAVEKKGALEHLLSTYKPDILLLQEIKSKPEQLESLHKKYPEYTQFYHSAEKPGYAGTAIWISSLSSPLRGGSRWGLGGAMRGIEVFCSNSPISDIQPAQIFGGENTLFSTQEESSPLSFFSGMPHFTDDEGRIARVDIGEFSILGVYFPNGGKSPEAWKGKLVFYEQFLEYVNAIRKEGRKVIWGGDINCAHEEIDLARPKENMESIGFLPEERAWVTKVIANGWRDIFRDKNPEAAVYSWWHVITKSRERNIGWRIDSFFVDEAISKDVSHIEYLNDQMGSDHCPVLLEIPNE